MSLPPPFDEKLSPRHLPFYFPESYVRATPHLPIPVRATPQRPPPILHRAAPIPIPAASRLLPLPLPLPLELELEHPSLSPPPASRPSAPPSPSPSTLSAPTTSPHPAIDKTGMIQSKRKIEDACVENGNPRGKRIKVEASAGDVEMWDVQREGEGVEGEEQDAPETSGQVLEEWDAREEHRVKAEEETIEQGPEREEGDSKGEDDHAQNTIEQVPLHDEDEVQCDEGDYDGRWDNLSDESDFLDAKAGPGLTRGFKPARLGRGGGGVDRGLIASVLGLGCVLGL